MTEIYLSCCICCSAIQAVFDSYHTWQRSQNTAEVNCISMVSSGMDVTRDILPLEKYIWGYITVSTRCIVTKQLWYPHPRSDFRPITHFVVKLERFLCDRTTPPIIQKLRSKGVTMHVYGVSAFYM